MQTSSFPVPIYAGEFRHAVDPKGRLTVPAKWRRGESEDLYVLPEHRNRCLIIMPPEEFKDFGRRVERDTKVPEMEKRIFLRQFYSQAQPTTVDRQGRMLLPEEYCQRVELGEHVMIAGVDVRFEIWNPDRWKSTIEEKQNVYREVADHFGL